MKSCLDSKNNFNSTGITSRKISLKKITNLQILTIY